jgi:prepilin-type N-terminal cleavage/methylation domain-containing protein
MISQSEGTRNFWGRNARARGLHSSGSTCRGFSLPELLISMAVMLVVAGAVISMISYNENTYARTEQQSDMYENVRAVAELMAQEIGQAGFVDLPGGGTSGATLSAGVTFNNTTAQTVAVSSTTSMYVNEILLVGAGASEEPVTLTAVTSTSISALSTQSVNPIHSSGAPIHAIGVSPNGIVSPSSSATTPTTQGSVSCVTVPIGVTYTSPATTPSTCNVLNLWGDLNSDGTLVYVRYTCNTPATPTSPPGTLTRSVTTITPGVNTVSTSQTLLSTLAQNPPSTAPTPCFQYDLSTQTMTVNGVVTGTYYMIANVGVTLSVQTLRPDPVTGQYLKMTKSFLDLSPRNILAGYEQANWGDPSRLQPQPPNVTLY